MGLLCRLAQQSFGNAETHRQAYSLTGVWAARQRDWQAGRLTDRKTNK